MYRGGKLEQIRNMLYVSNLLTLAPIEDKTLISPSRWVALFDRNGKLTCVELLLYFVLRCSEFRTKRRTRISIYFTPHALPCGKNTKRLEMP